MPESKVVISGGLLRLLAGTVVLLYKARHLSWRVNGNAGHGVQAVIERDHRALDEATDKIARHILALGRDIAPSYQTLVRSASITQEFEVRSEMEMIRQIADDHGQILADIDTLEVTMPLGADDKAARLLVQLRTCHQNCRTSLSALLPPNRSTQH